jgi:chromosome segregation ATPase
LYAVNHLSWEDARLIAADTKLADRTAAQHASNPVDTAVPTASDTAAPKAQAQAPASKGKSSPAPHDSASASASPAALTQLRAELAATQKTRASLEASLGTLTTAVTTLQLADTQQKQRIAQLEKHRAHLERRGKDKQEELKGKGRFVEEIQDEMVALNLQLNMAEQEKERLKKENEELTRRWVRKMEEEASRMNREMGWEEQGRRK